MAVYSGVPAVLTPIGASDTTLLNPASGNSFELYAGVVHNTGATVLAVEIFLGSDAISAAGERVFSASLEGGETRRVPPVTVRPGYYLIGLADSAGINFYGTYARRTGTDMGLS